MADELRTLGLPKRAVFSSSAALMRASFDGAEVVTPSVNSSSGGGPGAGH
jgi:hypothetical protein